MSWADIHVGDYGWTGKLTLLQDGNAVDISTYTTCDIVFVKPTGVVITKEATFDTDGTNGVLACTIESNEIDVAGIWRVFARVARVEEPAEITSSYIEFEAKPREDG